MSVQPKTHDPNEHDHSHEECLRLPCLRCGIDPITGRNDDNWSNKQWSCCMCDDCWMTYEADMLPEERSEYLIEEIGP